MFVCLVTNQTGLPILYQPFEELLEKSDMLETRALETSFFKHETVSRPFTLNLLHWAVWWVLTQKNKKSCFSVLAAVVSSRFQWWSSVQCVKTSWPSRGYKNKTLTLGRLPGWAQRNLWQLFLFMCTWLGAQSCENTTWWKHKLTY